MIVLYFTKMIVLYFTFLALFCAWFLYEIKKAPTHNDWD